MAAIPGDDAARQLVAQLSDEREDVRWAAIDGLARRRHTAAARPLVEVLKRDRSPLVRIKAAGALGAVGERGAVPPLLHAVENDPHVAAYAALSLGQIADEVAIPTLKAAWQRARSTDGLRFAFVAAIGRIDGPLAALALRELIAEQTEGHLDIVLALREMKHVAAVPVLLLGLADEGPGIAPSAREALWFLARHQLVQGIEMALADGMAAVRRQAVQVAPFYADHQMIARLRKLSLSDRDPDIINIAKEALLAQAICTWREQRDAA